MSSTRRDRGRARRTSRSPPSILGTGSLRSAIADGNWTVLESSTIDGQQVTELRWSDAGDDYTLLVWVNAETYLPVKEVVTYRAGSPGAQVQG